MNESPEVAEDPALRPDGRPKRTDATGAGGGGTFVRTMTWLQATPAELLGLIVLLAGALAVTGVVVRQADRRPDVLPEAAGVGREVLSADESRLAQEGAGTRRDDPQDERGSDGARSDGGVDADIAVHVSGAVQVPGVVRLRSGARVSHAVSAAGGARTAADLDRLNLARVLVDGEQVHVPREGEQIVPPSVAGPAGDSADDAPIDLNTASSEQLEGLPGIGPAKAAAIVRHRDEHGRFDVPGDLRGVPGIGERTFQQLADLVTAG